MKLKNKSEKSSTWQKLGAVLVLDEAEALLRQRTSNGQGGSGLSTGVAYILTRFDSYTGILVATTNRMEDLDEAFFRRFDDFAVLPIPDKPTREMLWRSILGEHDSVDYDLISNTTITGGLIKGAAIRARAWAFGLDKSLTTPFVLAALVRELEKTTRIPKRRSCHNIAVRSTFCWMVEICQNWINTESPDRPTRKIHPYSLRKHWRWTLDSSFTERVAVKSFGIIAFGKWLR